MLYSEFIEGTECKQSQFNYEVYEKLNALYMAYDNLTKEDIYAVGKRMVDNTPSEEVLEIVKTMERDIDLYSSLLKYTDEEIAYCKNVDPIGLKARIKDLRNESKLYRRRINACKFVLGI